MFEGIEPIDRSFTSDGQILHIYDIDDVICHKKLFLKDKSVGSFMRCMQGNRYIVCLHDTPHMPRMWVVDDLRDVSETIKKCHSISYYDCYTIKDMLDGRYTIEDTLKYATDTFVVGSVYVKVGSLRSSDSVFFIKEPPKAIIRTKEQNLSDVDVPCSTISCVFDKVDDSMRIDELTSSPCYPTINKIHIQEIISGEYRRCISYEGFLKYVIRDIRFRANQLRMDNALETYISVDENIEKLLDSVKSFVKNNNIIF